MSSNHYDIIVAGTGSMGAAACYYLSMSGAKVLGLDQFAVPHDKGSHGGQSRIIRKAYFEHTGYVPLLDRSYENWQLLEKNTGEKFYHRTGLLYCGPTDHVITKGVKESAASFNIQLDKDISHERFPLFSLPSHHEMLFEPDAGFLLPGKAITAYIKEATIRGARINNNEKIISWEKKNGLVEVFTTEGKYSARTLVITAGAWAREVLKKFNIPLKVTRQLLVWVQPKDVKQFSHPDFPCWFIYDHHIDGTYYGFPYLDAKEFPGPTGLKFALHYAGETTDPNNVQRDITEKEISAMINGLRNYFPAAASPVVQASTCLYTNTPDENFIIDYLPGLDNQVILACGFSGHGFKFVPVIGEIIADLAVQRRSALPIEFLSLKRFTQEVPS